MIPTLLESGILAFFLFSEVLSFVEPNFNAKFLKNFEIFRFRGDLR